MDKSVTDRCSDCPPVGYPTDTTRCLPCDRHALADAALSPALDNTAVEGLRAALEPVMHWYQSDEHDARQLLDIVADVVADLQEDRKTVLAMRAFTDEQITALAERFCATPLPDSVYADACARLPGVSGRTGTNLLTVSEAEQMLRAILNAAGQAR